MEENKDGDNEKVNDTDDVKTGDYREDNNVQIGVSAKM